MNKRILLTGGGTAGSVTPLIALAENIRKRDPSFEFLFLGTADGPERVLADTAGITFRALPSGKFRRYWSWQNLSDFGNVWRAFMVAGQIIRAWKPAVVMSAGSFVSVPVVWAAKFAGAKIMIHQQDVRPGLANRLMQPAASIITVTFPKSVHDFPANKVQLTGNPVRPAVLNGSAEKAREIFQLVPNVPVLVVVGGGTGSNFLNQITAVAISKLIHRWQIIHLTGTHRQFVEFSDPRYHRYDFLTADLPHALAAATVVISRSGLGMITELSALGRASIFVPIAKTHQDENAQYLAARQAGIVVTQDQLTADGLMKILDTLLDHPEQREALSRNIHELYRPEALDRMSDLALSLIRP